MKDYIRIFGKKFSRNSIIFKTINIIAKAGPIIAPLLEPKKIDINKVQVPVVNLDSNFENLTIAHISDIHAGPYIQRRYVEKVVNIVNSMMPDLVVITGDFSEIDPVDIKWCSEVLSKLKSKIGIYGVMGNHDYWNGEALISETLLNKGINILRNEHKAIHIDKSIIYIAGIDDYRVGNYNLSQAVKDIPSSSTTILLSHNPDIVETLDGHKIDLMLCGHTHGGQWQLPLIGPLYLSSKFGKRYAIGFSRFKNTIIYTNKGIGTTFLPFRIFCPPEITMLTLKKAF